MAVETIRLGPIRGPKGDKGDTGPQGIQGVAGVKGDKGDKGDMGPGGSVNMADPVFTGAFSQNRLAGSTVGSYSHAEGLNTLASGKYSHAEGGESGAHAEYTHAEGRGTTAQGTCSHAEGRTTEAYGTCSHVEGYNSVAEGDYSHAEGYIALSYNFASHASGKCNKPMTGGGGTNTQIGDVFVIGNGTSYSSQSNAFRIAYTGAVYGKGAFNASGADYAEFIYPWQDGNPDSEDRVGYFVTIENQKIRIAHSGDYIAGIISGAPSVVGSGDEDWLGRYERDEFNRVIMEDVPETVEEKDEDGNIKYDEGTHMPVMIETGKMIPNARMKQVEGYDATKPYIERKDRPEWDYVGMLGVIPVRDDGTCRPGQFCKCNNDGIATLSDRGVDTYMVIERVNETVIKVIMR